MVGPRFKCTTPGEWVEEGDVEDGRWDCSKGSDEDAKLAQEYYCANGLRECTSPVIVMEKKQETETEQSHFNPGEIAGITIGSLIGSGILGIAAYCFK